MSTNKIILFLLIILYSAYYSLFSQELKTEIFNTTDGLSSNKIRQLFQDSFGFLWIGTEDGLNRYDGYEFKKFRNNPNNSETINSNVIWWVTEDDENNLWIATGIGVSKYLRVENKFKNYDLGLTSQNFYSSLLTFVDSKKNIWASSQAENIRKYNKTTDSWDKQKFVLIDSSETSYTGSSVVVKMVEDINEKLWIASLRYGLMWYDEKEKIFREAEIKYEDGICKFINTRNQISDLFSDSLGVMWITTRNGIYKYNTTTKILKTIQKYNFKRAEYKGSLDAAISQDRFGNVWITNMFGGLLKFDGISDNYKRLSVTGQIYSESGMSNYILGKSLWGRSGIFWIGTLNKGLIKYDPNKKIFSHYTRIDTDTDYNSISNSYVSSLLESKKLPNTVYVGTEDGLNILNTKTNNFSRKFKSKYGGNITSMVEEEDGSLWLGTLGEGLLKMDAQKKIIKRFTFDATNTNSLSNNVVNIIRKDSFGNLWIGTSAGGLNYFDTQTKTFTRLNENLDTYPQEIIDLIKNKIDQNLDIAKITKVEDLQNLSVDFEVEQSGNYLVVSAGEGYFDSGLGDYGWIEDDNNNILWSSNVVVGSNYHFGGAAKNRIRVGIISLKSGKHSLKYKSDNGHSFGNWNGTPPNEQSFWGIRIFRIDNQNELENIKKNLKENVNKKMFVNGSNISAIHLTKNNIVWVGTYQYGLQKINVVENSVKTYLLDNGKKKPHSIIDINDIYEDNYGTLWIATNNGLFKFDSAKETYIIYTVNDGLAANFILSILPGENNELWMSTKIGVSKMLKHNTGKPIFINYGAESGVDLADFYLLAKLKTNSGKLFFGGRNGLVEFDSEKVFNTPPILILSDLKISNVSIVNIKENTLAKTNIFNLGNISLSHTQNDLSFKFTALHFSDPKENKYAHKLEGYEDEWIYDNSRIATYTNLDPGEYTFKFKGSNSEGLWDESGKSISIIISPPWWLTWWAYTSYVFLIITSIYGIRKYELSRIQLKNKLKLESVTSKKLRELDQVKSHFFANISHEFRTPLTLILGQINNTLSNKLDSKIKYNMEVANRSGQRLLNLINQLLDLSKIESGSMNIKRKRADIVSFVKNIFYLFESQAEQKKITYNFNCNYSKIELNFDPQELEKVFFNLLSNAFKFTPDGGKIELTTKHILNPTKLKTTTINNVDVQNGFVEIFVTDTGGGIPAENIPHIFDRFYQVDNSTTREHQGIGIGLSLCKELIELHGGKIGVESKEGEGSVFIVLIPIEDGSLSKKERHEVEPEQLESVNGRGEIRHGSLMIDEKELFSRNTNDIKNIDKEIILVVEDNNDVRNYITEQLTDDFQVIEAKDGQEGISIAKEKTPDLIITDVMMPKIDGYQLTTELKQDDKTSHIPIVMLTAKAEIDNKIEGFEIGADDYILKPFNTKELLVRVKNLIATRHQLRRQFSTATIIKPSDVTAVSMDQQFLQKVINVVDKHLEDEQFGVDRLADEANMSVSQLNRKLGALIDQPAGKLIRSMRLQRAADLLKTNSGTIAEICYQLGFSNQANFTRAFKQQFKESPLRYKKKLKNTD